MVGPLDTAKSSLKGKADRFMFNSSLNLHCSSYQHDYGKEGFSTGLGHHYGTGYSANLKPAVYYSPSLDLLDNPNLGVSLLDNFQSQTEHHYQPLTVPSGAEALPRTRIKSKESGYLQLDTYPRQKLVSLQTEYKCSYTPQRPALPVYHKHQILSNNKESGFTDGNNLQHNILAPQDTASIHNTGQTKTQSSVMKMDFGPMVCLQGNEVLPKLVAHASRETAFTRHAKEPLSFPDSQPYVCPRGPRKRSLLFSERTIGRKEGSGFVLNTPILKPLPDTPYDPLQFLSHYHTKFCNKADFGTLQTGCSRGGVQSYRESGYSGRDTGRFNL